MSTTRWAMVAIDSISVVVIVCILAWAYINDPFRKYEKRRRNKGEA